MLSEKKKGEGALLSLRHSLVPGLLGGAYYVAIEAPVAIFTLLRSSSISCF